MAESCFPALRRRVFEPLQCLRNRSSRVRYWHELERTQHLSIDALLDKQWCRLRSLLEYVYTNNEFYRRRFDHAKIKPADIESLKDVQNLPVLAKTEIQKNGLKMLSSGYDAARLQQFKTGGSTGKSLEIYITEECSEIRNALARRHDRWTGWEVGEPIGAVWGNPKLPRTLKDMLKNWLLSPTIYLDTMNVSDDSVRRFAKEWTKTKPTLLFGHAHSLYVLAQYVRALSITEIRPRAILSTSMMLLPHERRLIEQVFGVKVFDRYGCEEVSLIASECERHEGMHLNVEHLLIEFLKEDGTWAGPGEAGRIVVTDLMNHAMPFIRYDVEDIGVPSRRTCSCGRGLPLMDSVTGRVADFLIRPDGSKVAGVSLIENTLTRIPGIDQMQIVQENIASIVINIVPGSTYDKHTAKTMIEYFKHVFTPDTGVRINRVQSIQPEKSGKYRFSICRIAHHT